MQSMEDTAELYVSARIFLAYSDSLHTRRPPSSRPGRHLRAPFIGASRPVVDALRDEYGPYSSQLVRTTDQTYITHRPRGPCMCDAGPKRLRA